MTDIVTAAYRKGTILCRRGNAERQIMISNSRHLPNGEREFWVKFWHKNSWSDHEHPIPQGELLNLWIIVSVSDS